MASLRVASHKAAAPLHAGAICQSSGRYVVRLAVDDATREDAYRLRYESYLAQGHITANPARMFKDPYDNLANDRTVVVYDRRGAIGSVRLCLLASLSAATPGRESFPAEVERLLNRIRVDRGHVAAEITRLVRSPAASDDAGLVFLLYRLANYVGHHENVSLLLASARRNHAIFYRRLGFSIETEPRPYPGLTCPMQLLSCDRSAYEESFTHFPMIVPVAAGLPSLNGLLSGKVVEVPSMSQRYAPRRIQWTFGDALARRERLTRSDAETVDDVENARLQEVRDHVGQHHDRPGSLLGRLENHAISPAASAEPFSDCHQQREFPGDDLATTTSGSWSGKPRYRV